MTLQDLGSLGEFVAAIATVVTLAYLAIQIRMTNSLSRAEASRAPNSDLNALNAAFGTQTLFRTSMRQILNGAGRKDVEDDARTMLDFYLISMTNLQNQLAREIKEGVLDPDALDFGGAGLFALAYYRDSWPLYRPYFSSDFVDGFEGTYGLDPSVEAEW